MSDWDNPLPFVTCENGKFQLHAKAIEKLEKIKKPLVSVCVAGGYRTTRSYVVDQLIGQATCSTHETGVELITKGIWVLYKNHPEDENKGLIFMVTEGLDYVIKDDETDDMKMLSLSILLSSTLIYNVIGKIDNSLIDKLNFVTNISKYIRVNSNDENDFNFDTVFPHFVLVCRDKPLQLEIESEETTADECMERLLLTTNNEVVSSRENNRNKIKMKLRKYFPQTKCFSFVHSNPNLKEEIFNPQVATENNKLFNYIFSQSNAKIFTQNKSVTGRTLVHLSKIYVDAINNNSVPCIGSAIDLVASNENSELLQECVSKYVEFMNALKFPLDNKEFESAHSRTHEFVIAYFANKVFLSENNEYLEKLKDELREEYEKFVGVNYAASEKVCNSLLDDLFEPIQQKIGNGSYLKSGGYDEFVKNSENFQENYNAVPNKGILEKVLLNKFVNKFQNHLTSILVADEMISARQMKIKVELLNQEEAQRNDEIQRINLKQEEIHRQAMINDRHVIIKQTQGLDLARKQLMEQNELQEKTETEVRQPQQKSEKTEIHLQGIVDQNMGLKTIIRDAVVGRNAAIGDLYDIRNDSFLDCSALNDSIPDDSIKLTKKSDVNIKHIEKDLISEKFNSLEIEPELKMSILSDLVSLEGYAKYFTHVKKSQNCVEKSVAISHINSVEELLLNKDKAEDLISKDAISLDSATHFVFAITWGTKVVITLEQLKSVNGDKLKEKLVALSLNLKGVNQDLDEDDDSIICNVFADAPPSDYPLTTLRETEIYVKKVIKSMQFSNKRKGKPLTFTLMPIEVLNDYIFTEVPTIDLFSIKEELINVCIRRYDDINDSLLQVKTVLDHFEAHSNCIPIEQVREGLEFKNKLDNNQVLLKSQLRKLVPAIRSGKPTTCLEQLFTPLECNWVNQQNIWLEKTKFINEVSKLGVQYVGNGSPVKSIAQIVDSNEFVFILLYGIKSETDNCWEDVKAFFLKLVDDKSAVFVIVDLDVRPELMPETYENKIRIMSYSKGQCDDSDVYATNLAEIMRCMAKGLTYVQCEKPPKRVNLELVCPGSLRENCEDKKHLWHCERCKDQLTFGFDYHFYCSCGKSKCETFKFKCCSQSHDFGFIEFPRTVLKTFVSEIPPMEEINILVLGATGVGKSTWLNAFANYITYPTLTEAGQNKLYSVTSSQFQLTDEDNKVHKVQFGKDENERHGGGQSSTQKARGHLFSMGNILLRLIDTPGIGDSRGIEQDKQNFANILAYLKQLDKIHCICILLKPNESKLNILFEFCIKQLLVHLHKSSLKNIVFCFTHSRTTFYKPGDTRVPLEELLKQNQIPIELKPKVMYCMDNESFRFLCAKNQKIPFDNQIEKTFSESWAITVKEINRLLKYIKTLEPHIIIDTISLNDARKNILCLSKPIADISANIQRNITEVENKREQVLTGKIRVDELSKDLYVDMTVLKAEPLSYPRTVCGSSKCVTFHKTINANSNSVEYITICHDNCQLENVPIEIIGDRAIRNCWAMNNGKSECCRECGCSWDQHLHITYVQRQEIERKVIQEVQDEVCEKKSKNEIIRNSIKRLEITIKELEEEQQIIRETSVKLGCYLSKNAIVPYNDVIERYIDHLIEKERDKSAFTKNDDMLKRLEAMRAMYSVEVETLKRAMAQPNAVELDFAEFQKLLKSLYKLKHNGKDLQNAFENASKCEQVKHEEWERFHEPQQNQRYGHNFQNCFESIEPMRGQNKSSHRGARADRMPVNIVTQRFSRMKKKFWK